MTLKTDNTCSYTFHNISGIFVISGPKREMIINNYTKLYQFFSGFNSNQIYTVIQMLDSSLITILKKLFGSDLKESMKTADVDSINTFATTILPKMHNLLNQFYNKSIRSSEPLDSLLSRLTIKEVLIVLFKLGYVNGEVYSPILLSAALNISFEEIDAIDYPKSITVDFPTLENPLDDYFALRNGINRLAELNVQILKEMFKRLSIKEVVISTLYLGIDGYSVDLNSLCMLLNEEEETIITMVKRYLLVFQGILLEEELARRRLSSGYKRVSGNE